MKLVLFDLDGTLLLTHGAGVRAMTRAGTELLGPTFSLEAITISGGLDPSIFEQAAAARGAAATPDEHEAFRDAYRRHLEAELTRGRPAEALPGIPDLLGRLRQDDGVILGLLTGNYAHTGPVKLRAAGIDPDVFEVSVWGDEAPERRALVGLAIGRCAGPAPAPGDVIVVGDTPRDIDCAKANGCVAFAVATGAYDADRLRHAGADHVVEHLGDPSPLLRLL